MAKVFLFSGLSGAGKTTLAQGARDMLGQGAWVVLDGDAMRRGLNRDLGFSRADREENIRRLGEIAVCLAEQGINVILAVIAPYESLRRNLAQIVGPDRLRVVFVACPLEECMRRDPKHNYAAARSGKIENYTGLQDGYEEPREPDLVIRTDETPLEDCLKALTGYLKSESAGRAETTILPGP